MRIGFGYDIHRLEKGKKLVLGGVEIPSEIGMVGHSDADVLLHAICDALLGASALGDIGKQFPDTDPKYKGISSLTLLEQVKEKLDSVNYAVQNIDSTVVLESPKISSYSDLMKKNIAEILGIHVNDVSIKATTNEKVGFVGRGEGCAAFAVAVIAKTV